MLREESAAARPTPGAPNRKRLSRRWRSRRGVSEVVATILLLALTVVLFSSIFAFVTSFPAPPAQNSNQFQANLVISANASGISGVLTGVTIVHLAGPAISQQATIYLRSAVHPTWLQFSTGYTLADGGITGTWNLGQTWTLTSFTGGADSYVPDNITISIIQGAQLVFSDIVPGTVLNLPPTFLSVGTTPAVPAVGQAFQIYSAVQGITTAPTIVVSGLPGSLPAGSQTMHPYGGEWVYNITAGLTTTSGTYYSFITAVTAASKTGSSSVPVYLTPYSTLIATALSVGTPTAPVKCTAAHAPAAACQAVNDTTVSVPITASSITLGSVSFEVYTTTTNVPYTTAGHSAFALALTATPTTTVVKWVGPATGPLLVTSSWTITYTGPATTTSPLTNLYTISIDLGTASVPATLSFIVLGIGVYSSQTLAVAIP
jgi:flagellin-like protein